MPERQVSRRRSKEALALANRIICSTQTSVDKTNQKQGGALALRAPPPTAELRIRLGRTERLMVALSFDDSYLEHYRAADDMETELGSACVRG